MGEGCWLFSREPEASPVLFVTRDFALQRAALHIALPVGALHILSVPLLTHACSLDFCGGKNYPHFLFHILIFCTRGFGLA